MLHSTPNPMSLGLLRGMLGFGQLIDYMRVVAMNRNSGLFTRLGEAVDGLILNDPVQEELNLVADRVSVGGSYGMTTVNQMSVTAEQIGRSVPENLVTSLDVPANLETQGEKFYIIHHADWRATSGKWTILMDIDVADMLIGADLSPYGIVRYHRYGRFGMEVLVQVNATNFMAGALLAAMVPVHEDHSSRPSYLCYPSGIINCSINNMIRIKVPWVYTRGNYDFKTPVCDVWKLQVLILSPLAAASNTSPSATVTVMARFTDLEIHGQIPYVQMMRNIVRLSPSSNIINLSNRNDARANVSFAIDNEVSLPEPAVAGGTRIRNFREFCSIPGVCWTFKFQGSYEVGTRIGTLPVSPFFYKETYMESDVPIHGVTPLCSIAQMYAYWRCDIVFTFQAVTTPFHSGRLMFSYIAGNEHDMEKEVSPEREPWIKRMTMKQAANAPSAIFDIRGSQSSCVFRVPFTSDTHYRTNRHTTSIQTKREYETIGNVNIYVYNKLAYPNNVAPEVDIIVWISADNVDFISPLYKSIQSQAGEETGDGGFTTTGAVGRGEGSTSVGDEDKLDRVPVGAVTNMEDPLSRLKKPETFEQRDPGDVRHSRDHMDIYAFMGRCHWFVGHKFLADHKTVSIPLDLRTFRPNYEMPSTLMWFNSLYHLVRGPIDLTIVFAGAHDVDGSVWFSPPGVAAHTDWEESDANMTTDFKSSLGEVRFNTRRSGCIQVRVPWYNPLNALTPHSFSTGLDCSWGHLNCQIDNYNHSDEYIQILIFVSFPEQTEFYFKRAPINNTALHQSAADWVFLPDLEPQTVTLPDPIDEEAAMFNARAEVSGRRPYKNLRLEVGGIRLSQARDELVTWRKKKAKSISDLLHTQSGLVTYSVAKRTTGDTTNYGIVKGDQILSVSAPSGNFAFKRKGTFFLTDLSGWVPTGKMLDERLVEKLFCLPLLEIKFDWSKFVSGKFSECFNKEEYKVMIDFVGEEVEVALRHLIPHSKSLFQKMSGLDAEELGTKSKMLIEDCREFLQTVKTNVSAIAKTFSRRNGFLAVQMITSVARVALLLYSCHQQDWNVENIGPLVGCIFLEAVGELSNLAEYVINKSVMTLCESGIPKSNSGEFIRNAVGCVSLFKSAKDFFFWLLDKIKDWYDKHYGEAHKAAEILDDSKDEIELLLNVSDDYVLKQHQEKNSKEEFDEGTQLVKKLRTTQSLVNKNKDLREFSQPLRDAIMSVSRKVNSLGCVNTNMVSRNEPIVLYIYGERGGGKSLLSMAVAAKLCKMLGVDPERNIYSKAVGSEFWDGYDGQMVCLIDDIGQNTDDEEWKGFCQLVSSAPMRLDMAHLEKKGQHFMSPFIICTSNIEEPNPKTIYIREAILRRLSIKVKVTPKQNFVKTLNNMELLDVNKAKLLDAIKDMSCVKICDCGQELSLDDLVGNCYSMFQSRESDHSEFLKLWTQSDNKLLSTFIGLKGSVNKYRLGKLWEAMKENKWWIVGSVVAAILGSAAIYGVYRLCKSQRICTESAYTEVQRKPVVKLGEPKMLAQSLVDKTAVVQRNLCRFGIGIGDGKIHWMLNCLGITKDYLVVPSHCFRFRPDVVKVFVEKGGVIYSCDREKVGFRDVGGEFGDLMFFQMPGIPPFKDIRPHFVKRVDLEKCSGHMATLATNNCGMFQLISEGDVILQPEANYRHVDPMSGENFDIVVSSCFRGSGDSSPGSCGGVLISSVNSANNPFLGIHVAAGNNVLLAKVITQEQLEGIEILESQSARILNVSITDQAVNLASRSKFLRSPIHDQIAHPYKVPAALPYQKSRKLDVMAVMMSKFSSPVCQEPEDFQKVVNFMIVKMSRIVEPGFRLLSTREAILGIPGMDPIDMNTSAGYPYNVKGLRKRDLIDAELGVVRHFLLDQRLSNNMWLLNTGGDLDVVFTTCAKDELREVEKVEASKTRAIEAAPVDFTIMTRRLWGYFVSKIQLNPGFKTGSAVGIDADTQWHDLYHTMMSFSDVVIDLDYKNFDGSLSPYLIAAGVELLCFMSGLDSCALLSLSKSLCFSRRIFGSMMYTVVGALPSGTSCTSILNTVINNMIIWYALSVLYGAGLEDIEKFFLVLAYGDDVVVCPKRGLEGTEKLVEYLPRVLCDMGLTVTSSLKGPVRLVPVMESQFLSRTAKIVNNKIMPCLKEISVWSLLAWRRKGARFKDNIMNACWFYFPHGREAYNQFRAELVIMLMLADITFHVPTWEEQMLRFYELDFKPLNN
nr:Genome polyprotein [Sphenimaju virus]